MDLETKQLIESFKAYRDLLTPIQRNLSEFIGTYDTMRQSVEDLSAAFGGDLKESLDSLLGKMSKEAQKAADLSGQIDKLSGAAVQYAQGVDTLVKQFSKIEQRLSTLSDLDQRASAQVARLDAVLEEKSKSYNLKELQGALDNYNRDIKKVGDFLNKDVADTLLSSRGKLDEIKGGLDAFVLKQRGEGETLEKLLSAYNASGGFLKKIAEGQDVNEAYLFEVLDRWAAARKVKTR